MKNIISFFIPTINYTVDNFNNFYDSLQEETEEFIEYWKSEGGKKKNWQLTWKNRMRDQQKRYGASKAKRATKARPENFANKDYGETKVNF